MKYLSLLLCAGCSLVNDTSGLRDLDGGAADSGPSVDAGPGVDVGPGADAGPGADSGPGEDGGSDAGPSCVPLISRMEVDDGGHPPTFRIEFTEPSPCDEAQTLMIREERSGTVAMVELPPNEREVTFLYNGPRVPIYDAQGRMRTFRVNDQSVGMQMPVEQFQIFSGVVLVTEEVSYPQLPHLDVANDGTVVFDSNESELGAEGDGDIILWQMNRTVEARVDRPIRGREQYVAPAISGDGRVIGCVRDDSMGKQFFYRDLDSPGRTLIDIPTDFPGMPNLPHLDVSDAGEGNYRAAVHTFNLGGGPEGTGGVETFELAGGAASMLTAFEESTPPLLFGNDGVTRLSGAFGDEGIPFWRDEAGSSGDQMDGCTTLPETLVAGGGGDNQLAFVGDCGSGRMLFVGENPLPVDDVIDGVIDAADDLSLMLLQRRTGAPGENTFILVDNVGAQESIALDAQGEQPTDVLVHGGFAGAAISPNGEWVAYSMVTEPGMMRVYRVPTRNEVAFVEPI